jgi:hypothetical protein
MWNFNICFVWVYVDEGRSLKLWKWIFFEFFVESVGNALDTELLLSVKNFYVVSLVCVESL